MLLKQVGFVSLKDTCIIRRIPSVEEVFILTGNLVHWADSKSSFCGKQHAHKKISPTAIWHFFPFLCVRKTLYCQDGGREEVMSLFPCGFMLLIYQIL